MAASTETHFSDHLNGVTDNLDTVDGNTLDDNDSNEDNVMTNIANVADVELQKSSTFDEIPEPIKVLDDIISEFEDSKPVLLNNGENQSEDDGYMSLSRKNIKKENSEEISIASADKEEEEENELPAQLIPAIDNLDNSIPDSLEQNETDYIKQAIIIEEEPTTTHVVNKEIITDTTDKNIVQSTLPKVRQSTAKNSTNYSSLPCSGLRSSSLESKLRSGTSVNGERNKLGIDISAVHKAVIRGSVAKLPEPILNEHPVTIYPGCYSPQTEATHRGHRSQRFISSVEKHKEVCHILKPLSSVSSSSSSPNSASSSDKKRLIIPKEDIVTCKTNITEYEYSDDSLDGHLISPLTSSTERLTPKRNPGIAWEIHFENDNSSRKKKSKLPTYRKAYKKRTFEKPVYETKAISNLCYGNEFFKEDYSSADELNSCYNQHTSMLGKGTFVIRRATNKKPPLVIDIFKEITQVNNPRSEECERKFCEREPDVYNNEFIAVETRNLSKQSEAIILKPRILEIKTASHCAPLISTRDRLLLNVDTKYTNAESMLCSQVKSPIEEFKRNSLQRTVGATKQNESLSTEDIMAHSSKEELFENAVDIANFESSSSFSYKNGSKTNGLKNQEYNDLRTSNTTTPHTDLAPTLEEDEELSDLSYSCAPLKQIESNISALLRGEITVVRTGDMTVPGQPKRVLEFRPGVHKSESAKEMLLSQNMFGPLPPSPPSSNPDLFDYNTPLPPLPASPSGTPTVVDEDVNNLRKKNTTTTAAEIHTPSATVEKNRTRDNVRTVRHFNDELPLPPPPFENLPPAVPPHRVGYSANTMKSWSIDSNYKRKSPKMLGYGSGITTPTGPPTCEPGVYSAKRYIGSYGTKRSLKQSPREEHRLQTSCSLPETPIFARGCDIPRTPYRRQTENTVSGSRTAPRSSTSHSINMGNSIVGIAGGSVYGTGICRQRSINHALASNEMLRLSGVPARGWYPKQRSMRPASTENIDRLTTMRVWDTGTVMSGPGHSRKPCTLPPNLTPSFLNKSPREALRRVTSLLITKKKNTKENKNKSFGDCVKQPAGYVNEKESNAAAKEFNSQTTCQNSLKQQQQQQQQKPQKKKGLFKNLWKKTKHFSLDQ